MKQKMKIQTLKRKLWFSYAILLLMIGTMSWIVSEYLLFGLGHNENASIIFNSFFLLLFFVSTFGAAMIHWKDIKSTHKELTNLANPKIGCS